MKKTALALLISFAWLPVLCGAQQIIVRMPPPPIIVERPGPAPEPGFVWISGYQRWDGDRYVWVPGHYERPPHEHGVWVGHRWAHRGGHWAFVEGHWR